MKPQALNIIKMISKPISDRMPFQGVQLTKFVQKLTFFKRYFPYQSQKFISLCLSSLLMDFRAGEFLYARETQPNLIYILVIGSAEVKDLSSGCIRTVNAYDLVGHVEVVFKMEKRHEEIVCLTDCQCMALRSDHFHDVWQHSAQIKKSLNYLRSNKYFENLSAYSCKYLCLLMMKGSFKQHDILVTPGTINDRIFFIIYGQVLVTRKLQIKKLSKLPSKPIQKQVVLDSLQEMDCFGEYQAINNLINDVTLRAANSGLYYAMSIAQLMELKHPLLDILRDKGLPYPDKEELEFRFSVQADVEKCKNQVKRRLRLYE